MQIQFNQEALDYIKRKGGTVHLAYTTMGGGCCGGGGILLPEIFLGTPKGDLANYREQDLEGIKVFLSNKLAEETHLKVTLDSFLFFKKLTISGAKPLAKQL